MRREVDVYKIVTRFCDLPDDALDAWIIDWNEHDPSDIDSDVLGAAERLLLDGRDPTEAYIGSFSDRKVAITPDGHVIMLVLFDGSWFMWLFRPSSHSASPWPRWYRSSDEMPILGQPVAEDLWDEVQHHLDALEW